ncbi:alpha-hydroxy-acid oxidizing protein [Tsukamurella sp. 8F]|uniref:alpha-hydroxy-acid oxidizing protein n=1 Tax=unclassified Tsukamurella TaxID=2633480 RepID=UPI0023B9AA00|nr:MULTISPECIES: alpha-hydroxy-acid oxidizing protein [unclassified Tsukamurella]MDF0531321.1 alpha-hydroxy-acid oxidizing protein [Tsukamurella sp. 8J]MDF0588527.1 alpha-hydroxy-acid oxidizing protein [Tsukamurella sp. 8F]
MARHRRLPFSFAELERRAGDVLDHEAFDYIRGGAGDEYTQDVNVSELRRYGFVPRMLRDRTARDLSTSFLGRRLDAPVFLCPVGANGMAYPDGDVETARAAAELGVAAMYSTLSDAPLEEIADARGDSFAMFQLYPTKDDVLTDSLVKRAAAAGFDALAITLDTGSLGWRPRDLANAYIPFLRGRCLANYTTDPRFLEIAGSDAPAPQHAGIVWASLFSKPTFSWEDVARIRRLTDLPIVLKGICHPGDARRAAAEGVDAIACSNHGGRQANGGIPAIAHLADVIEASGLPVTFDSGVRDGVDILRVVGLGAVLAGIARPYVYGLALGGREGVVHVVRSMLAEADLTMAADCYASISELEVVKRAE